MVRNYLKISFRFLFKDRFYSLLNIAGLSIGIATSLLIFLFIRDELSYDRFHKDADRIYRVATIGKMGDQRVLNVAVTSAPLAEGFREHIPEVEEITRIRPYLMILSHNEDIYKESKVFYADSTFFDVFSFKMMQGDAGKALTEPYSIVLTEETAIKYFGQKALDRGEIIGQLLKSANDTYKVTGIVENVPYNSHFDFDILVSMSTNQDALNPIWINMNYYTYLKLKKGTDPASLADKFRELVLQYVVPQVVAYLHYPQTELTRETIDENFRYYLQPLTDIHLHSSLHGELGANSDIQYIYIFSAIAIFIILIACINFMNLSTARSAKRAREVGIRKTMGSSRNRLIAQFLIESLIFIVIAILLAMGLTEAFRMPFNTISGKNLTFNLFQDPWILMIILGLTVVITIIAGSYPAFYLTRFNPVEVLKGTLYSGNRGSWFRSGLVIFQFTISIGLIVCTLIVYKQMHYIQTKNLGFNKENVIILKNAENLGDRAEAVKQKIISMNEVSDASYTTHVPSDMYWSSAMKAEGDLASDHITFLSYVDYDYDKTLELNMKYGRFFSRDFPSDSSAIIINEAAAFVFGWTNDDGREAIGKKIETITTAMGTRSKFEVIGVVRDFNFESLRNEVRPMALFLGNNGPFLAVRIKPGNPKMAIKKINETWKEMTSELPFEYSFLDEQYEKMFDKENRLGIIFSVFTMLAILIACLGLLGLSTYTAEQKTKEIGIRKAMGASISNIILMLNGNFTKFVIVAFIVALPVAWYFMNQWLKEFAYKTNMSSWPFILAGSTALLIAWLTVSYQSFRAARSNPVDSLRNE